MGIGFTEGLLIAAIALLFFGGKKIPQLGRTLGASIKGFKEGMHEGTEEEKAAKAKALLEEEKKKKS
jgi:sec-independent protein translocase protein TatA